MKIEKKSKQHFYSKTLLYFVKICFFYFEKIKKTSSRKQQNKGHAVEQLVDALLCYKPEGRELDLQ